MTNLAFLLLMTAASLLSGPATKVVTELMARGIVQQDEGVVQAAPVPQHATAAAQEPGSVAVLAMAEPQPTPHPTAPVQAAPQAQPAPAAPAAKLEEPETSAGIADPSPTLLALVGDTPNRRPDGSVFLPITVQRLIGLRTAITRIEPFAATQELAGRVVTDRDVSAMIQATQAGVIEAVDGKVPRVGDKVQKGELLAYQRPIIDAARQAEIDAKRAELRGLINMGEQRIARLKEVFLIRYRQSKIDAVQAEVDNYRHQLQIYDDLDNQRVEIRAQSAGVISRVSVVAGQIVEPQTTLFEIVDPGKLWVEAASFDPALAGDIASATAVTADGRTLQLRFSGGGLMLQNQAVPLQFNVVGSTAGLQVGKPVTVIVERQHSKTAGIKLPNSAVLHGATGETIVWERLSAEDFRSRPVNIEPLDGQNVVVTSGLKSNMRIVTADAAMLAQVR